MLGCTRMLESYQQMAEAGALTSSPVFFLNRSGSEDEKVAQVQRVVDGPSNQPLYAEICRCLGRPGHFVLKCILVDVAPADFDSLFLAIAQHFDEDYRLSCGVRVVGISALRSLQFAIFDLSSGL